ncbi:MAG: hypothetical protein V4638_08085 [Bacteroidota bacterium]
MKITLALLISISFLLISCSSEKCPGGEKATLVDLTGLDGCGFVIELEDGSRLEPTNLLDYDNTPVNGKKVWVKYQTVDGGSICMVGQIVEITCLEPRN